jgi:hypothetical protein
VWFPAPARERIPRHPKRRACLSAFTSLVVIAVDSMLRRANRAQAGIQRLHDQALLGAERSRVGIWLGHSRRLTAPACASKATASDWTADGSSWERQVRPAIRDVAKPLAATQRPNPPPAAPRGARLCALRGRHGRVGTDTGYIKESAPMRIQCPPDTAGRPDKPAVPGRP